MLNQRPLPILLLLFFLAPIHAIAAESFTESFNCESFGDGPRYKIDVREFQIKYSGESLKANLGFISTLRIGAEMEAKTLQKADESTQQWNQLLVGLAEGYNSCAIPKKQFEEALRSLYPGLQSDARQMVDIGKALQEGRQVDVQAFKRLLDQYFQKLERIAKIGDKKEIIQGISDKIEEEHEKTRKLIKPIEPKLDQILNFMQEAANKDQVIANLTQQLQETKAELKKRGSSEAISQLEQGHFEKAEEFFQKEHLEGKAEAAYHLGNIKSAEANFTAAADYYTEAKKLEPNNPEYNAIPKLLKMLPAGYLPPGALPDSRALIPPPPAAGLAAMAYDEEVSRKSLALRNTPRWTLAMLDADLGFPQAAGAFSCALNAPITEQETPHLYMLLRRTLIDAGSSTFAAKNYYSRMRPFVVNKQPICTPMDEEPLTESGSYPSGHAAVGCAWALILSEIAPEQADAIGARGRAFGESRVICNVHWQSDVTEGCFMGTSTVGRLHGDPTFRADLEAAKAELAAVRAKGLKPLRNCAAEAAAMAK